MLCRVNQANYNIPTKRNMKISTLHSIEIQNKPYAIAAESVAQFACVLMEIKRQQQQKFKCVFFLC